jgi:hypothetical protein
MLGTRSVSGRVDITGRLGPDRAHRIETVSGDVLITATEGAAVACRTLSGRIHGGPGVQRDLRDGLPALVVGDGRALVRVRTVSGDIHLARGRAASLPPADDRARMAKAVPDPMLEALEALARGDISVDEAHRRLEAIHG